MLNTVLKFHLAFELIVLLYGINLMVGGVLSLLALYPEQWAQAIWYLCPHCGF